MSNGEYNGLNPWNSGTWSNGHWYPYKSQAEMGSTKGETAARQQMALTAPKSLNEYMRREQSARHAQMDAAIRYAFQCSGTLDNAFVDPTKGRQ